MTSARPCDERIDVEHEGRTLPLEIWRPETGPSPAVLVICELLGLNDDIRRIARRFADHGYLAAAPDLYRGGHYLRCAWRSLIGLQLGTDGGPSGRDLQAALDLLDARDDVTSTGAIGFCMGGGFALLLGTMGTARAVGGFYGPSPTFDRMQRHMCPVVGGYGARDRRFAREGEALRASLEQLDVPHDIRIYDGCGHSFMSESHELSTVERSIGRALFAVDYDEAAAEDSWSRILAFFAEHLGAAEGAP